MPASVGRDPAEIETEGQRMSGQEHHWATHRGGCRRLALVHERPALGIGQAALTGAAVSAVIAWHYPVAAGGYAWAPTGGRQASTSGKPRRRSLPTRSAVPPAPAATSGLYATVDDLLTGRENLELIGLLYHLGKAVYRRRAQDALERMSLAGAGDDQVRTYSGGMRRRLDLAASLIGAATCWRCR
jgi:hypothetical protein